MALFRVDFSGRGELADRQQKLAQMLSRLQKVSEGTYVMIIMLYTVIWKSVFHIEYNVAVFVTNQMTADPGGIHRKLVILCILILYFAYTILLNSNNEVRVHYFVQKEL